MRKVILFPFRILLVLAGGLLDLFIKAECWLCGIAIMILAVCILLAVANQMWLQAGILAGCVLAVLLGVFFTANIKIWIDLLAEKMLENGVCEGDSVVIDEKDGKLIVDVKKAEAVK